MSISLEYVKKLRKSGLRPTKQRIKICEILFSSIKTFHFTINDLSKMAEISANTKISLATIYNTIHAFKRKGYLKEIAINSSDDIIGFSQKGQPWYKKIMGRGKAYEMELGQGAVNAARTNLQKMMPERLAAGLSKKGIRLGSDDLVKLSDDVADMLGKRSYNSLETILAGNYSGRIMNPLMNVVGAFAQEAVNFAVVGTAMDIVQHAKGDYNPYEQRNFFEQTLHHTFFGGLFGPIKFIPGAVSYTHLTLPTKA